MSTDTRQPEIFAFRNLFTGDFILSVGRDRYEAAEALVSAFPDWDAAEFEYMPDGAIEMLIDQYGGTCVCSSELS